MVEAKRQGIALVGMAARFPGAPDLDAFRVNIEAGVDALADAPPERCDPVFHDAGSGAAHRLYTRRGGFLPSTIAFDAVAFGIMPIAAEGAEPDQLLALDAAARALADAGYDDRPFSRERAGVVVGRGGYLTAGVARLDQRVRAAEQLVQSLRALLPGLDEGRLAAVRAEVQAQLGPFGGDTAIGLVPSLAASRIANRLDLGGAAYTVDAACASSLLAVDHACRELEAGRADLMLAGGVHLCQDATFWSVFCQLGALSRAGQIRPFDRRADGLLIGEGVGMVVMKRLADAERDGDRIYAVIRGTGVSSDGRGASLLTPSVDGQLLALARAWQDAGLDPATVGLVEAHGTGTPAGDSAELETLRRFFGPADPATKRAALGSVKSMIGHAMPAAGIAGLIKAALAIHRGVLPPTLHCEEPRPALEATRFHLPSRAELWEDSAAPRRAGVSAFGFGGINAHVVLEQASTRAPARRARTTLAHDPAERPLVLAAADREALLAALDRGDPSSLGHGPCRLALFDPTPARRARARAIIARGEAWRGRDDLWFAPRGLVTDGGKIAFLFPGVDATFEPRVDDVAAHFGLTLGGPLAAGSLGDLGRSIIAVNRLLDAAVRAIGVRPDVMAGHSIGEWSGMIASEMIPRAEVDPLIDGLAGERVEVPGVLFLAAGCGEDRAAKALVDLTEIALSHDNCPHQVVLCGREQSVRVAEARLVADGVFCHELPFRSGYHSPLFAGFVGPHRRVLARVPLVAPATPLWSATSCAPYPADPDAVRRLAIDHLVKPVRFRELIEALHAEGAQVFLQIGTGSLPGFVSDTLRGRPHLTLSANVPARSGLAQLQRVAAALFVEGASVALERLLVIDKDRSARRDAPSGAPVMISLGVPLAVATTPLDRHALALAQSPSPEAEPLDDSDDPIVLELARSFSDLSEAQREIVAAFRGASLPPSSALAPREATERRALSVEEHPALLDHAFYRQPAGWPVVADRYPVVPMTMILSMMMTAAKQLVPELLPVGLEEVRALRWLAVAPPVEVTITSRFDGVDRVEVTIEGYASGTVALAAAYAPAPCADVTPLADEAPAPITAADLYTDRWMFHGPAYQGITALHALSPAGIRGTLVGLAAEGGLLDNAGQLLGYWVMEHADRDRLAMPVLLEQATFYGPEPRPGEAVECTVRVRRFGPTDVRADVELAHVGAVWARIEGWEDRRFDSDERVWSVLRCAEKNAVAALHEGGFVALRPPWGAAAPRDLLARRYLSERERAELHAAGPRGQDEWLLARIAVKDAVRHALWQRGAGAIFPIEIEVEASSSGALRLTGPRAGGLRVAVDFKTGIAVAIAADARELGIAVELAPPGGDAVPARLRAAREAAAKARSISIEGLAVREVRGDRLRIAAVGEEQGIWIRTCAEGEHVVAWTEA